MRISHVQRLVIAWLCLSILLTAFLFSVSRSVLKDIVGERLNQHLLLALDESLFGDMQNRLNDEQALQRIGQQINIDLQNLVQHQWYSPFRASVIRLQSIGDILFEPKPGADTLTFEMLRNQVEREVVVNLTTSPNWWIAIGIAVLLGLLFAAINVFVPPPLSKAHRQWINYLLERGYSGPEAFNVVSQYDSNRLVMSPAQLACVTHLHDNMKRNFSAVLAMVTTDGLATLREENVGWFLRGLEDNSSSVRQALELATVKDALVINLQGMTVSVRGLNIPMSRTPLFYYAWYAMNRTAGDGWITNPASNRPDMSIGQDLVQLMSQYGGHGKAINDLEQSGLKARTLDQNRSKIKDELVAALGESLAAAYVFETRKHPDGIHTMYRLQLKPAQIKIIQ